MKIRVVYSETEIVSVDRPEGATAIDYERYNLAIADHTALIPSLTAAGVGCEKVEEFLLTQASYNP